MATEGIELKILRPNTGLALKMVMSWVSVRSGPRPINIWCTHTWTGVSLEFENSWTYI